MSQDHWHGGLAAILPDIDEDAALEASNRLRGSEDRRLLDAVMLWAAREIGVDFDAEATFNEDPKSALSRNQDRVDGLVAAISAAANSDALDVHDAAAD